MGLIFFPCLILLIITGKQIFLWGVIISLIFMIASATFSSIGDLIGSATENEILHSVGFWILFGVGAIIVYAMMHT